MLRTTIISKHRIQWTQNSIFLIKNQSEGLGTWPNGWSACSNSLEHWIWVLCAYVKSSVIAHTLNLSEGVQGQGNLQGSLAALFRLVSEHKMENDVVRGRPPNSNFASICIYAHECICTCIYTHRYSTYMQKHIEEYPYIYIYTKETIREPDISVDALKNKKEN